MLIVCYIWCTDVMFVRRALLSHRNECVGERVACMCTHRKAKKEGVEALLRVYSR